MKKVASLILLAFFLFQCDSDSSGDCSTRATVRDLTGLDGCGWVFELENGTRLEPTLGLPRCGFGEMNAKTSGNPLDNFEFVDGKPVYISYEIVETGVSICMVGPVVRITCLSEVEVSISEE